VTTATVCGWGERSRARGLGTGRVVIDEKRTPGVVAASEPNEATVASKDGAGGRVPDPSSARRPSRLRAALVGVLVLLCSIVVIVTGVTWWAHYTVMDTDGYMKLVGPVGKDPEAIQNLSQYIGSEVVSVTDLQRRISDALAAQGQASSAPTTAEVQDYVSKGAARLLATPQAYQGWLQINRMSHQQLVALLRGQTNRLYAKGSDVTLNLLPLISQALTWVDRSSRAVCSPARRRSPPR
jgi:hypothetical protein